MSSTAACCKRYYIIFFYIHCALCAVAHVFTICRKRSKCHTVLFCISLNSRLLEGIRQSPVAWRLYGSICKLLHIPAKGAP